MFYLLHLSLSLLQPANIFYLILEPKILTLQICTCIKGLSGDMTYDQLSSYNYPASRQRAVYVEVSENWMSSYQFLRTFFPEPLQGFRCFVLPLLPTISMVCRYVYTHTGYGSHDLCVSYAQPEYLDVLRTNTPSPYSIREKKTTYLINVKILRTKIRI